MTSSEEGTQNKSECKEMTLAITSSSQSTRVSCQHMHNVAAVPAEVQLCLDLALLSDMKRHWA